MWQQDQLSNSELYKRIRNQSVTFGGNKKLKIFGLLHCASGKRMKKVNRVFFASRQEAEAKGYRPCGHCMRNEYQDWKSKQQL